MSSRGRVLGRVRRALADVRAAEAAADTAMAAGPGTGAGPAAEAEAAPPAGHAGQGDAAQDYAKRDYAVRDYLRVHGSRTAPQRVALLAENLADYRAHVHHAHEAGLPAVIARLLTERGAHRVAVPHGLPGDWLSAVTAERVPDSADLTARELDAVDSVVTGCAVAIAETGTIVLDTGPGQGRRHLTLVPDHHLCVVRVPEQVVDALPQALELLAPQHPLTWISGPSATSDIELNRVEGVHGPRTLDVVLVTVDEPPTG
ncbi:LutC/YkgG family protein [Streptomyces zagrosensis]|uniref:L-lactate dehydrogenase complex protein LldG n=1 Tax=Streptomyces zagrosensis TaxID=1042984 RepID=A0A7W9V1M2_9ACTN|nr:LUD domain-containing protein [Streptomyces zagrosensis]MBB5938386.1 L-lactate dehydrogenase complex protein LldG [Streptomyces zagrosensis]